MRRLGQILFVLLRFFWTSYIQQRKSPDFEQKSALLLRTSLENLGSVFIKFGQMLALRPDIIPNAYCRQLYKLLDQVPSFPKDVAENILTQELGPKISELTIDFDAPPVASASFAQVHKAQVKTGETVAVKIQRPNMQTLVDTDLFLLKKIARIIDILFAPPNSFYTVVEEFESWTRDELNYQKEAKNIETFNLLQTRTSSHIRGPYVYKALSSQRVLTMEYIKGQSLAQIIQSRKYPSGFDGNKTMQQLIRNTLEMAHIHGFFHADPHPANIIATKGKQLVFIDFGIMGTLGKRERILILRYLRSMLRGNAHESFHALIALCAVSHSDTIEHVKKEYELLVKRLTDTFEAKTYIEQQKQSGPILLEALNLLQRNGFQVPLAIVRYFKTFETIEGLIFALYPTLQVKDMLSEFRRVSILNIIDAFPQSLEKKRVNELFHTVIDAIEDRLLLERY